MFRTTEKWKQQAASNPKKKEMLQRYIDQAGDYEGLGGAYSCQGQYKEAFKNFRRALAIADQIGDCYRQAGIYHSLGRAYHLSDRYEEAIPHFQKSIKLYSDLQKKTAKKTVNGKFPSLRIHTNPTAA